MVMNTYGSVSVDDVRRMLRDGVEYVVMTHTPAGVVGEYKTEQEAMDHKAQLDSCGVRCVAKKLVG